MSFLKLKAQNQSTAAVEWKAWKSSQYTQYCILWLDITSIVVANIDQL